MKQLLAHYLSCRLTAVELRQTGRHDAARVFDWAAGRVLLKIRKLNSSKT